MKCENLFSGKIRNYFKMSSAAIKVLNIFQFADVYIKLK